MKLLLLILVCVFGRVVVSAQIVAIQERCQTHTLYLGYNNPLVIAVENCASTDVVATTNNGVITGSKGHYQLTPDHPGIAVIKVGRKIGPSIKILDSTFYKVGNIPLYVSFGGKTGGNISKARLCVQVGIAAEPDINGMDGRFLVDSFTIAVSRNGSTIYKSILHNKYGAKIDTPTYDFFKTLQNGDKITFKDIEIVYGLDTRQISPSIMEFTVVSSNEDDHEKVIDPITGK